MSDWFEIAPRPLAIFDAAGSLITQNEADRLCFGQTSLSERFENASEIEEALGIALVDESFCKDLFAAKDRSRWRANFRRLRAPEGDITLLVEFSDLPSHNLGHDVDHRAVAAIAHDFRAPLTAIRGFAEFLATNAATPERQADYLEAIQAAAEDLTELANQFVAHGFANDNIRQLVDLNELAHRTLKIHEVVASEAGASIHVDFDPAAPQVFCDPLAATRILQNLVTNALRHSHCATVAINVAGETITVTDNGAGMERAALDAALLVSNATAAGGLGLANCVALAETNAARIEFSTAPGKGFSARLSFEA